MNQKPIIIVNGGAALEGCPRSWDEAREWEIAANEKTIEDFNHPEWSWDCGFKLDYDGALLRVSSRFYPPKTHYGPTWDGHVTVMDCHGKELMQKAFDCNTLDELRTQVEDFVKKLKVTVFCDD